MTPFESVLQVIASASIVVFLLFAISTIIITYKSKNRLTIFKQCLMGEEYQEIGPFLLWLFTVFSLIFWSIVGVNYLLF